MDILYEHNRKILKMIIKEAIKEAMREMDEEKKQIINAEEPIEGYLDGKPLEDD